MLLSMTGGKSTFVGLFLRIRSMAARPSADKASKPIPSSRRTAIQLIASVADETIKPSSMATTNSSPWVKLPTKGRKLTIELIGRKVNEKPSLLKTTPTIQQPFQHYVLVMDGLESADGTTGNSQMAHG